MQPHSATRLESIEIVAERLQTYEYFENADFVLVVRVDADSVLQTIGFRVALGVFLSSC